LTIWYQILSKLILNLYLTDTFIPMSLSPEQLLRARAQWKWRGTQRPPFAHKPKPGQISVWDFPRPPELVRDTREIVLNWGSIVIARTRLSWAVRETSHPPTYYLPLTDVRTDLLQTAGEGSFCEWKGPAHYWNLVDKTKSLKLVAWSYPRPLKEAKCISDCIAFYAHELNCTVGGLQVTPQPGQFYGGWITSDLAGPFKGEPGSSDW